MEVAKDEVANKTSEVSSAQGELDKAKTAQAATKTEKEKYSGTDGNGGVKKASDDALTALNNSKTVYSTAMQKVKDEAQATLDSANATKDAAKANSIAAAAALETAKGELADAESKLKTAQDAQTAAESDLKTKQDTAKIFDDAVTTAKNTAKELGGENNQGTEGNTGGKVGKKKAELTTAKSDLKTATDEWNKIKDNYDETDEAQKAKKDAFDNATNKVATLDSEVKGLEEELKTAVDNLASAEKAAEAPNEAVKTAETKVEALKKETQTAQTNADKAQVGVETAQNTQQAADKLYADASLEANKAQQKANETAASALLAEQATQAAAAVKAKADEEAKKSALASEQKNFDEKDKAAKEKAAELQNIKDAANKANAEKAQATEADKAAKEVVKSADERKDTATKAQTEATNAKKTADDALGDNSKGAIKAQADAKKDFDTESAKLPNLQATAKEEAGKVITKEGEAKTAGVDESVFKGKTSKEIQAAADAITGSEATDTAKKNALNALATAKKAQEDADKKVSDQNVLIGQKDEALKTANTALEKAKKDASDAAENLVKAEKELAAATAAKTAADEAAKTAAATLTEKEKAAKTENDKIAAAETAANQAKKDAETAAGTLAGAQSAYDTAKAEATKLAQSAASAATAVRDNLANEASVAQSKADGLKQTADKLAAEKATADKKVETATQAKTEAESAKKQADDTLNTAKGEVTKQEDAAKTAGVDENIYKGKDSTEITKAAESEADETKKQALQELAAAKKEQEAKQALADDADKNLAAKTQDEKEAKQEQTKAEQAANQAKTDAETAQAAADTAKENLAQADADVKNLSQILADLGSTQTQQNLPLFADINQQAIYSAFSETLANSTLTPEQQKQAVRDIDESIQKLLIATPRNMMRAFKMDTFNTAMNAAYVSRLTADSEMIINDAGAFVNPMEKATETQFFFTPFGGVMSGNDISGNLFGFAFGLTHIDENYIAQGHFSYGRGKSSQDLDTQSTDVRGNLFQVGGFTRLLYGGLETDINLNFVLGAFDLDNSWLDSALNSSANFNNYQGNLGVSVGKRFGEDLSVKPYVGLQSYYESQDEFRFDALALKSDEYKAAMFDALVGVEGRYIFESGGFVFARVSYENKLYNSHKEIFMRAGNEELKYDNESYDNVIGANLGARVLNIGSWKLDIEGIYKRYNSGLNFFGGNLGVKKSF